MSCPDEQPVETCAQGGSSGAPDLIAQGEDGFVRQHIGRRMTETAACHHYRDQVARAWASCQIPDVVAM